MDKRRRAVSQLDWQIVPPDKPTAKEKANTEAPQALMAGLDDFELMLFDVTDAIGKGFAPGVRRLAPGRWRLVAEGHRSPPADRFQLARGQRQEIRLRGAMGGEALQPFAGSPISTNRKAGTWSARRCSVCWYGRTCSRTTASATWPSSWRSTASPCAWATPGGATEKEKPTLLRALAQLGHSAAGILIGMEMDLLSTLQRATLPRSS